MKKNKDRKMGKRGYFLLGYGIVVLLLLIFIIFLAPSKWFQKKTDMPSFETHEYTLEEQISHILNKQYEYEYNILYADRDANYTYKCRGKLEKEEETGTCSFPEKLTYDNTNVDEVFEDLNNEYLDLQKLFDRLENVSYTEKEYEGIKVYVYNLKINSLETDIELYSNYNDIIEIRIDNVNEHYQLKYSNILY